MILLILAGVTIAMLTGENGILNKANKASSENDKQTAAEKINLKITTAQIDTYTEKQRMPTLKEVSLKLGSDDEIAYVTEASKVASTEYNVPSENPSAIYTKLNEYPYEFEIDDKLRLATVDGVKVADSSNDNIIGRIEELEIALQNLQTENTGLKNKVETLENETTETELIKEPMKVGTTTNWQAKNKDFPLENSIREYKFLLFKYGTGNQSNASLYNWASLLVPVDGIVFNDSSSCILLSGADGQYYTSASVYFKDEKTLCIYETVASNSTRKNFTIDSIKGIK